MTVGFIGNFRVPFTTENDLRWSLEDLGHTVIPYQETEISTDQILADGLNGKYSMLFYVHTHGWVTPGNKSLQEVFRQLKDAKIPTISFHLDYWRGLKRERDVGTHPFWKTEYVFTADGGSNDWYRSKGINHYWIRPGVVKRDCVPGTFRPEYACDIAFVGSKTYHEEWPYRARLINWLEATYGDKFMHIGQPNPTLRGQALNDFYASAKVVVGDTLCLNFDHPYYWSDRLYETIGRGGFIIHPWIRGITDEFETENGCVLPHYPYGQFHELHDWIEYYLEHEDIREQKRLAAHEIVKQYCTYTNRMKEILDVVGGDRA